jgi:hypothetical protein
MPGWERHARAVERDYERKIVMRTRCHTRLRILNRKDTNKYISECYAHRGSLKRHRIQQDSKHLLLS